MTHTEYIRDEYWDGGPALDVYVVEDYNADIDIDRATINDLLGYKKSFWPHGFWRVGDDRPINRVFRRVGLE
jgi:hypothetical protein